MGNMAHTVKFSNWVQFDEEDKVEGFQEKRSEPWPIAAKDSSEAFKLSESLSSFGSEMSFDSNCDETDDDSRYYPLKEIQLKLLEKKKEVHTILVHSALCTVSF